MERITYAIGDIHGRLDLLLKAADAIERDLAGRPGRVFCLGDYIDRGPDSRGVVEFLMRAQRDGALTCLTGNHEDIAIQAHDDPSKMGWWLRNGGDATLESYGGAVSAEHIAWIRDLPSHYDDGKRFYVHAGIDPAVSLAEQSPEVMMWIRTPFLTYSGALERHVVHGHTPQHEEKIVTHEPELLPHRTNLDTGACYTGVLAVGVFSDTQAQPLRILTVGEPEE